MKRVNFILIGLVLFSGVDAFAKKGGNGNGNGNNANSGDYISVDGIQGNFEDAASWQKGNVPPADGIVDKKMTINGTITRNGKFEPVTVNVNGTFYVDGDYLNNKWEGLTVNKDALVAIYGNLSSTKDIIVAKGGVLIVHGNLTSSGSNLQSNGDVIVKGDFYTSSNTHVQNKGNLVVGGDFTHDGGGLKSKSDDLYILDPNATITSPGWGIIYDGDYGTVDDFMKDEESSDLGNIVDEVGMLNPAIEWLGREDANWSNASNWKGQQVPDMTSSVKINSTTIAPVINGDVSIANLTISEGASVVVKPAASLEVTEDVKNHGLFVLESEAVHLASLMLPKNASMVGEANVKLLLPSNHYWYLSSPLKNAEAGWFKPAEVSDKDYVYVFEVKNNRWQWIRLGQEDVDNKRDIALLHGLAAYYYDNAKQLDYTGEINNNAVVKEFNDPGFHLLGNPFPTAIDWSWENSAGWEREGFSNTIWSWVDYNGKRVVQTYNGQYDILVPKIDGYNSEDKGHIPAYQSVWIKQKSKNATMVVKNEARVNDSSAPLKSVSSNNKDYELIRVRAENEKALDETVLFFDEGFKTGFGPEDAEKRFNGGNDVPEVFTRSNDKPVVMNGLPPLEEDDFEIPLSVRNGVVGDVKLSFDFEKFSDGYDVFLEDKETGDWANVRVLDGYTYQPTMKGDDESRFVLHIQKVNKVSTSVVEVTNKKVEGINIIGLENHALVEVSYELLNSENAQIEVLDISGRLIKRQVSADTVSEITLPQESGIYIFRVKAGGIFKSGKVVRR